jgi:filamentous hemagglutinin family protein
VPDNTLGAESSTVTPDVVIRGIPSDQIDGGAIRGANLFHSFEQLSVLEGRGAYFANPAGVENILSRVTGANCSDILGRLGVLGNANLFLINPNGIVFGQNASLDVQGSFLATTADAVKLGDGGLFSASQPTEVELSENSRLSAVVRGTGTGGDLTIETGQLLISDGAVVDTSTIDEGAGDNLTVLVSDSVSVDRKLLRSLKNSSV